jgi:hypothetical protein
MRRSWYNAGALPRLYAGSSRRERRIRDEGRGTVVRSMREGGRAASGVFMDVKTRPEWMTVWAAGGGGGTHYPGFGVVLAVTTEGKSIRVATRQPPALAKSGQH